MVRSLSAQCGVLGAGEDRRSSVEGHSTSQRLLSLSTSSSEETVARPRHIQILAQRSAFVAPPINPTPLQLGHYQIHEIVEAIRKIEKHHVEAVAGLSFEPGFHGVRDGLRRADQFQGAKAAADPLREFTHRELFALCAVDDFLA